MTEEEQSVLEVVKGQVADWDDAYIHRDAHGLVGHGLPDDPRLEQYYRQWSAVTDWTENTEARSMIRHFSLNAGKAVAVVEQCRSFSFRRPLPEYAWPGRMLLGFMARFVFREHEVARLTWVNTREGWLCENEHRLSYWLQVRRRESL